MNHPFFRVVTASTVLAILVGGNGGNSVAGQPVVDGRFGEWTSDKLVVTDAAGDASSVFDVTEVYAASAGTLLYVSFGTGTILNVQASPPGEDTLRLEVGFQGSSALTIDLRNRNAYTGGNPSNYLPWSAFEFEAMTTHAADRFEIRADLGAVGIGVGDTITLNFSGSDTLDAPVPFTLQQPAAVPVRRDPGRLGDTSVRIASLNTLRGGLLAPGQTEPIGRLVRAVAADVYCFQEQNSPAASIANRLAELDPLGNGLAWDVHRVGDTAIATQQTMIPLFRSGDAATIIDFAGEGAVLVFSVHPPCCGYIGSSQDKARVAEMAGVVATIAALRSGQFGQTFEPYRDVPVIIIGDWNLVGSRTPLDLVEDQQGPAMTHWLLPHLIGDDVHTWRDLFEAPGDFAPGLLDLLTYSSQQLVRRNGFVLDSLELDTSELQLLGLESGDSGASDHLMLVGDFLFGNDCNNNGIPDKTESVSGGDFDGDGVVDGNDMIAFGLCSAGPDVPPVAPELACVTICLDAFDGENDGDVDLNDLATFQVAFKGSSPGDTCP